MGTRNLTAVMVDGDYKVAQYGQWDGYPSGQGIIALEFLRDKMDKSLFLEKISQSRFITNEEDDALWEEVGITPRDGMVSTKEAKIFKAKYPLLDRDAAAESLSIIQNSEPPILLKNSIDFAGDSLFCEWAYVVDFDKETFEVYGGFNKEPIGEDERFAGNKQNEDAEYYPVKLLVTFDLNALPTNEEFLACFADEDEEEKEEEFFACFAEENEEEEENE